MRQQGRLETLVRVRTTEIEQARLELYERPMREQQRLEETVDIRAAETEEAHNEPQRMAMSDVLTSLPSRRAVMLALEAATESAIGLGTPLAVLGTRLDEALMEHEIAGR